MKKTIIKALIVLFLIVLGISGAIIYLLKDTAIGEQFLWNLTYSPVIPKSLSDNEKDILNKLNLAAIERTTKKVNYDPAYVKIDYPNGDVPEYQGVCSDVIIRSYRRLGIDLQKDVHEDIRDNFDKYPKIWGLQKPDTNIDHRRVPNLMIFFKRKGISLPLSKNPNDYLPGDIVTWNLGLGKGHIGIVVDRMNISKSRPLISHNIGSGPEIEDVLFDWEITGHFRYFGIKK